MAQGEITLSSAEIKMKIETLLKISLAMARKDFAAAINVDTELGDNPLDELVLSLRLLAEELEESTIDINYLNGILASLSELIIVVDGQGYIRKINNAVLRVLGFSEGELVGHRLEDFFSSTAEADLEFAKLAKLMDRKKLGGGSVKDVELNFFPKNGEKIPVLATSTIMETNDGQLQGIIISCKDMRESLLMDQIREKLENELSASNNRLIQASKMASLGEMAASVAHECNNPLSIIKGFASLAQNDATMQHKTRDLLGRVVMATNRMAKIVDHLRIFSRQSSEKDWRSIAINKVVDDALILLEQQLKNKNITIKLALDKNLPKILGDSTQLESVLINLIGNSRDAFEDLLDTRERIIKISTSLVGDSVILIFEDNAGGMNESTLEKIFDPFVTTKEANKGTGLGLSITFGIVKQHGGEINCSSREGQGTTFTLNFPRAPDEEITPQEKIDLSPSSSFSSSTPRLLIIDDEEDICDLLTAYLEKDFRIVTEADSSKVYATIDATECDLIVTDLNMPGLSGVDIVKHIKRKHPTVPVLAITGYGKTDKQVSDAIEAGVSDVIHKPFDNAKEVSKLLKSYCDK